MGKFRNAYSGGNKYYTDAGFVDPNSSPELIQKFLDSVKTFYDIDQNKPKMPLMANGPFSAPRRGIASRFSGLSGVPNRRQQIMDAYNQSINDWYKSIDDAYGAGFDLPGHKFDLKGNTSFGEQRKFSGTGRGLGQPASPYERVGGIQAPGFSMVKALNKINPDWSQIPTDDIRNKIQKQTERYYARKASHGPLGSLVSPFSVASFGLGVLGAPLAAKVAVGGLGGLSK
jgi:hypothetical protein